MGRRALENRDNWQAEANQRGSRAEVTFSGYMRDYFRNTNFIITDSPKDLNAIYGMRSSRRPHGIRPDHAITNLITERSIYIEVKRQRAAGNAHERACKYMMPGILASARRIGRHSEEVIPFWWVFTNGIANNPDYRQEIMHWFYGMEGHLLLWQDRTTGEELSNHFEDHIRPLLEYDDRGFK